MFNEEILRAALFYLTKNPEHQVYFEDYVKSNAVTTRDELNIFYSAFKSHFTKLDKWNNDYEVALKILREQGEVINVQNAANRLFAVNTSRKINDNWINEFLKDLQSCKTGDIFREIIKPARYKTVTENLIIYGIDPKELSNLYLKYSEFNHPFVNYTVSSVLYNSKNYSDGLPILKDGVKSVASYPIHYWNNEYGIEGAAWMIGDLLYLLGDQLERNNMLDEKFKLLKLLYLYMSRYIYMTKSNLNSINFYSNRARIVTGYYREFISIFGFGVNPDIQFISDMYLAHQICLNNGLGFEEPFDQFYWDSMKMYRHGSHVPNSSGGYLEIEDATWMDLVKRGEIRSLMLGEKLLNEFENYELNLSNSTIDKIFKILEQTRKDDVVNYLNKIGKEKLISGKGKDPIC